LEILDAGAGVGSLAAALVAAACGWEERPAAVAVTCYEIEPLLIETDWEKYDGYTPTFRHPNLTDRELRYLLGAAYKRFYMRPSYLANFLKIQNTAIRDWVSRMDRRVNDRHSREEIADISRPVAC